MALLHSMSYFFCLYRSPSSSLCTVFDSDSCNIDEVLSINPSANVFVFDIHCEDWLTYLVKLINLGNYLLSQTTLLRWLTFLLRSLTVTLTVLLFWIYLFLLTLAFVLQWFSFHWEILIILLHQFPLTFHQTLNGMSPWLAAACTTAIVH